MKLWFYKLRNWEYWSFYIVYIPVFILYIYQAIRLKSLFFFNACNPSIKNGGMFSESKKEIYDLIPQKYYPKTILIDENLDADSLNLLLKKSNFSFPLIAKPDIGLRGSAVKKLQNFDELIEYNRKANFKYLIQDLIPYENEIGIFYIRFPNENNGKITGIVKKEFIIIEGNGTSTIKQLIKANPRYELQIDKIQIEFGKRFDEVLKKGKKLNLMPYGNHIRGAKFLDNSYLITNQLTQTIDAICKEIPNFYFGRLDIMFHSFEDLENGKNFNIVEINGAASEPTHIYDPKHSLFFAWKELSKHFIAMCKVSKQNKQNRFSFLTFNEGIEQYKIHLNQIKKFNSF